MRPKTLVQKSAEEQAPIIQWEQILLQSVEIMYNQLNEEEKLQKAVETLRSYGITLDIEKEAAVLQLKVEGKELKRLV